ncbi:MAG: DUF4493 domain-containing protein [Candidatus Cryptobacteroides sp.]
MKKILLTIFGAAILFSGCNEKVITPAGVGKVTLDLSFGGDWITKAESEEVDVNAFQVKISRPADSWSVEYARFDEMPEYLELSAASYRIDVTSGNNLPAAFDNAVYGGSTDFEVKTGIVTPVSLTATIQNVKVSFNPSDNFLSELSSYTITVSNGDDAEHTLVWSNDENVEESARITKDITKAGYFSVGTIKIHVDGYRALDNSTASYDAVFASASARDHFIVNLDAKTTGQGTFEITVDTSTNDRQEDVNVPGFEETPVDGPEDPGTDPEPVDPTPSDAITFVWAENPTLARTELKSDMSVNIAIGVENGIKGFLVKIGSPAESFINVVGQMPGAYTDELGRVVLDLTNADTFTALGGLLGIGGTTIVGQTALNLDLGELLPLIISVGHPEAGSVHTFTLDLSDSLDNSYSATLEFEYIGEQSSL